MNDVHFTDNSRIFQTLNNFNPQIGHQGHSAIEQISV